MSLDPGADLVTLLRSVVDVESVSGNEGQLADLVEELLREQEHLDVTRDGDCVVARTRLGRGISTLCRWRATCRVRLSRPPRASSSTGGAQWT